MANPRRPYYLFDHTIKKRLRPDDAQTTAVTLPVISLALESTGEALGLTLATETQLKTVKDSGVIYFRRGSAFADRCLVVYQETENNKLKTKTLHLPVPRYAPTYKVLDIANAANSGQSVLAGKIIGVRRYGYLFPLPQQQQGGGGGGGGGG